MRWSRFEPLANYFFFLPFLFMGAVAVGCVVAGVLRFIPLNASNFVLSLSLAVMGCVQFSTAKLSVIRESALVSFGSARMSPAHRGMYRWGYALMAMGTLLLLSFLLLSAHLVA